MTRPAYEPVDPAKLKTYSIQQRAHKVNVGRFARLPAPGASLREWLESLPDFLAVSNLRQAVGATAAAHRAGRPVVWALGAHVVKVGCSPLVVDLINRGVVNAVVMNGATAIHDVEVATLGSTSEEVAATIRDGTFGMVEETPAVFAEAARLAVAQRRGLGHALGSILEGAAAHYTEHSILAAAYRRGVPVTVHVAVGTDTVHMHASANGAQIGQASMTDFRLACSVVADLAPAVPGQAAGVWWNIGSSVLLPEVFLKAVAVARNLGANLDDMIAINLDMIRHYRPSQNVVGRPVRPGHGLELIGHHEIMLPLVRSTAGGAADMNQAAIFLDRDNTIMDDPGYVADPNQVRLLDGAAQAIRRFNEAGYRVVVVTNQSGIARGLLTEDQLHDIHAQLQALLEADQARLDGIYYCPYLEGPEAIVAEYRRGSRLRKPAPGMLEEAARALHIDLDFSWMIGDSISDVQAGRAAGCRTILLGDGEMLEDGDGPDHTVDSLTRAADIILGQQESHGHPGAARPPATGMPSPTLAPSSLEIDDQDAPDRGSPAPQQVDSPEDLPPPAALQVAPIVPTVVTESLMPELGTQTRLLREDLQRLNKVVEDIRVLLARQQRDLAQPDFSLSRLGATLFQLLAAALLLWGLFALIGHESSGELIVAVARFVLAGVVQLMALTLFILDRKTH